MKKKSECINWRRLIVLDIETHQRNNRL